MWRCGIVGVGRGGMGKVWENLRAKLVPDNTLASTVNYLWRVPHASTKKRKQNKNLLLYKIKNYFVHFEILLSF